MIANGAASSAAGYCQIAQRLSTPTSSAPTNAPRRLPRPPMTMTTNDSTSGFAPISRLAVLCGNAIAPAKPARNAPSANTSVNVRSGLAPIAVAISRSMAVARMIRPVFVRLKNQNRPTTTAAPTAMISSLYVGKFSPTNSAAGTRLIVL